MCFALSLSKHVSIIPYSRSAIKSIIYDVCCFFSSKHSAEKYITFVGESSRESIMDYISDMYKGLLNTGMHCHV